MVALLRDEPAAEDIESLLLTEEALVSSINLAEAIDQLLRIDRLPREPVEDVLARLIEGGLSVLALDETIAWESATLRAAYYQRSARALSLPDCVVLAEARRLGAAVLTSDPAIAETARLEGIDLIPVPDSQGRRP